jgi:hypothetical protein
MSIKTRTLGIKDLSPNIKKLVEQNYSKEVSIELIEKIATFQFEFAKQGIKDNVRVIKLRKFGKFVNHTIKDT